MIRAVILYNVVLLGVERVMKIAGLSTEDETVKKTENF